MRGALLEDGRRMAWHYRVPDPDNGVVPVGIGKGTLATAVAHDDQVRAAFPAGIFWLELGSDDVTRAQEELAALLKLDGFTTSTKPQRKELLEGALASRGRCLLILNDVLSKTAAYGLDLGGAERGTLVTTDDPDLLDELGAVPVALDVLPAAAAEYLSCAGRPDAPWRRGRRASVCGAIDRILEATARIPYHLAKVGAMIGAGGRSCRAVADDLASLLAEGDTYRSTCLALRDLPADDADLWRTSRCSPSTRRYRSRRSPGHGAQARQRRRATRSTGWRASIC